MEIASIWRCPACHGRLSELGQSMTCADCGNNYELVDGIPDLRYPPCPDQTTVSDLAHARQISLHAPGKSSEELIRSFFAVRDRTNGWTPRDTEIRTRQSLSLPKRLRTELTGWLSPVTHQPVFLDLGCGLGGLLSAASDLRMNGIGIDNRMSVLVVAKRLVELDGGTATLACANGEALPLADASIGGVVMYDVVEHVDHLDRALAEVDRAMVAGGTFACSTPNRFSLAPEPHVHIWGVGWLPRRYQAAYVKMRGGRNYAGNRLLSPLELKGLLRSFTHLETEIRVPPIPSAEIEAARGMRRRLGLLYNVVAGLGFARPFLILIGPFFQVIGTKRVAKYRKPGIAT